VSAATLDPGTHSVHSGHGAQGGAGGALAGSALSLNTWRQTLDTLRDLTARRT
jgi:hypothetical protein